VCLDDTNGLISKSQESKSFMNYLGFGKSNKLPLDFDSDGSEEDCNVSDNGQDKANIEKVFSHPSRLPSNFAEEVLDLEMEIESSTDITQKSIDRLVYLYSQAMEYYEGVDKVKYQSFKDRIQKLLVNPMVFSTMKKQEPATRQRSLTATALTVISLCLRL